MKLFTNASLAIIFAIHLAELSIAQTPIPYSQHNPPIDINQSPYNFIGWLGDPVDDDEAGTGFPVTNRTILTAAHVAGAPTFVSGDNSEWRSRLVYNAIRNASRNNRDYSKDKVPAIIVSWTSFRTSPSWDDDGIPFKTLTWDTAAVAFIGSHGNPGYFAIQPEQSDELLTQGNIVQITKLEKKLLGYPVDENNSQYHYLPHASIPEEHTFSQIGSYNRIYKSSLASWGGNSGGPLLVNVDSNWVPAAIYVAKQNNLSEGYYRVINHETQSLVSYTDAFVNTPIPDMIGTWGVQLRNDRLSPVYFDVPTAILWNSINYQKENAFIEVRDPGSVANSYVIGGLTNWEEQHAQRLSQTNFKTLGVPYNTFDNYNIDIEFYSAIGSFIHTDLPRGFHQFSSDPSFPQTVSPTSPKTGEAITFEVHHGSLAWEYATTVNLKWQKVGDTIPTTYSMNRVSTDPSKWVKYSRSFNVGSTAGTYEYWFEATNPQGETIATDKYSVLVSQYVEPVEGWDLVAFSIDASDVVNPGQTIITSNARAFNASDAGNTYLNVPWVLKLVAPNGSIVDSHTGTIASISSSTTLSFSTPNFTAPSTEGTYRVELEVGLGVMPVKDSDYTNNVVSTTVVVTSQPDSHEVYRFPNSHLNLYYGYDRAHPSGTISNYIPSSRFHAFSGTNYYNQGITQTSSSRFIRLAPSDNTQLQRQINMGDFQYFNNGSHVAYADDIQVYFTSSTNYTHAAEVSFGSRIQSFIAVQPSNTSVFPGQSASVIFSFGAAAGSTETFQSGKPIFLRSNATQFDSWYQSNVRSNSNKTITYSFAVPSSASPGAYQSHIKGRTSAGKYMVERIQLNVVAPLPSITSITPNPATAGQTVTVSGSAFGTSGTLTLSGSPISTSAWSSNQIQFIVPASAATGNVVVTTSAGSSNSMQLGVVQVPALSFTRVGGGSVSELAYGNIELGESKAAEFTIGNSGTATLAVSNQWIQNLPGGSLQLFSSSGSPISGNPIYLLPGEEISATISAAPIEVGPFSGTWSFQTNAIGSENVNVSVTGAGVDTTDPIVSISSPVYPTGDTIIDTATIRGSVSDFSPVTVTYSLNGGTAVPVTVSGSLLEFGPIEWAVGANVLIVSALDSSDNSGSATLNVEYIEPVTLTILIVPPEGGYVNGGGSYRPGETVTITATPNDGFNFSRWSEGGTELTQNPTFEVPVSASRTLVAEFAPDTTPPVVITISVSDVTSSSASVTGEVADDGGGIIDQRGFVISQTPEPVIGGGGVDTVLVGTGSGGFSTTISGLPSSTIHYVRAYATNSAGTAYGDQISFTTGVPVTTPTVTTAEATNVTETGATTGGDVTSSGGDPVIQRGIVFGTSPEPTTATATFMVSGNGLGAFTISLDGLLESNTDYFVRAFAINGVGTAYGNEINFTTNSGPTLPIFSSHPVDQSVIVPIEAVFSVDATGIMPLSYQWQVSTDNGASWSAIPGNNAPTYNTGPTSVSMSGNRYRCVVTAADGWFTASNSATLTVVSSGTDSIGDAVGAPQLDWTTGGHADWVVVDMDGMPAAASGSITHNQASWLETTVSGPGILEFRWKVSSEANWDFLRFQMNGADQFQISGEVDWHSMVVDIPAGVHTLRWIYDKDGSVNNGQDRGWLNQVSMTPGGISFTEWISDPRVPVERRSPRASAANDQVANIVKYFQGIDLMDTRGLAGLQQMERTAPTQMRAWFLRSRVADDSVTGNVRWSRDLVNWHDSGATDGGSTVTLDMSHAEPDKTASNREWIRVDATMTGATSGALFLRLEVDAPGLLNDQVMLRKDGMVFSITDGIYPDQSDWDEAVAAEFGPGWQVADWETLKTAFGSTNDESLKLANFLKEQANGSAYLKVGGSRFWPASPSRYYFMSAHFGNKPGSYLDHDQIQGNIVSLGSWWGSNRIFVMKSEQEDPDQPNGVMSVTGGSLNGMDLSTGQREIIVAPGAQMSGSVIIRLLDQYCAGCIVPIGYTWTWGSRQASIQSLGFSSRGTNDRTANINLTAPTEPGTYYIHFAAAAVYNISQVMSQTSRVDGTSVWNDGNDIWDLSSQKISFAGANGYVQNWQSLADWAGNTMVTNNHLALISIRIVVE